MTTTKPKPKPKTAAEIVARLNPDKRAADWNLRALLLNLASASACDGAPSAAIRSALRRGLIDWTADDRPCLRPLGDMVAAMLRPKPWTASLSSAMTGCRPMLFSPDGRGQATFINLEIAQHVAECMTEADRRAAKTYKTEEL